MSESANSTASMAVGMQILFLKNFFHNLVPVFCFSTLFFIILYRCSSLHPFPNFLTSRMTLPLFLSLYLILTAFPVTFSPNAPALGF